MWNFRFFALLLVLAVCVHGQAAPVGSGFSYQGELQQGGGPADGTFDFEFDLFNVEVGGEIVAPTVNLEDTPVVNGSFMVTLDFGPQPFENQEALWLEISVREGASVDEHTVLAPRQKIMATPFSITTLQPNPQLVAMIEDLQNQIDLLHPQRLVFVSSMAFTGAELMGAVGADSKCQNLAEAAGLDGTYLAWISDATTSPALRFRPSAVPYRQVDGSLIAMDFTDLTDGSLVNGVSLDETGFVQADGFARAWTATDIAGAAAGEDCDDWGTSGPKDSVGGTGLLGAFDATWTSSLLRACSHANRLYCFQQ